MLDFYRKVLLAFVAMFLISIVLVYIGYNRTFLDTEFLPADKSGFDWQSLINSDQVEGGQSSVTIKDDSFSLNFDLLLSSAIQYPYSNLELVFQDKEGLQGFVNLSQYDSVSFNAKCAPANMLSFSVFTSEDNITSADDYNSYRISSTFFSCNEDWSKVTIDLTRLETPEWWYDRYHLELSSQEYKLHKVAKMSVGSSFQSPFDVEANVQINEMHFAGKEWSYLYSGGILLLLLWGGFIVWALRQHMDSLVLELKDKMQKDRPLVAYQQLSIEPQCDKEKSTILRLMATEYADPELNLDKVVQSVGINRNKVNEILKEEIGYTFSAYLNKLRLTEAARLLAENGDANVSEIAYLVGYKNVPYFNKLFKLEYRCSPKVFKSAYIEPTIKS